MADSTISALDGANLPLTLEAVPCVQSRANKQAPALAFGIPGTGALPDTGLSQYQTWIDDTADPPMLSMWINSAWVPLYAIDSDGTLTIATALQMPGDPSVDADVATKHYVDHKLVSLPGALVFKGLIDCSASPNYPDGSLGDFYVVGNSGKIGGSAGPNVVVGDTLLCRVNGTTSGTQAGAGLNWTIGEGKVPNAVAGPGSAVDRDFAQFDGTSGTAVKDNGISLDTDATMAANSDSRIPSQKAVKGQIGGKPLAADTPTQGQVWTWDGVSASFHARDNEGRNLLVNPSFDLWQDAVGYTLSSTVPKTHTADFWKASGSYTNGRLVGHVSNRFTGRSSISFQRPSGFSDMGRSRLAQQLETWDSLAMAGKTVTVSFDFYVGANYSLTGSGPYVTVYWGGNMDEDIDLRSATPAFTSGGSSSSGSLHAQVAPYNSYSRIVAGPFTVPTLTGGSLNIHAFAFDIASGDYSGTSGLDDSYVIGDVKLEIGNIATPFRKPDIAETQRIAERRYINTFRGETPAAGTGLNRGELLFRRAVAGTGAEGVYVPLRRMRATPVVTLFNPVTASSSQARNITKNTDCASTQVDSWSDHGFRVTCTGDTGGAAGNWLAIHYVADARL